MAVALSHTPFVVVDLETTGGSAAFDRVLEVAAIRVEHGVVQERLDRLFDPGVPTLGGLLRVQHQPVTRKRRKGRVDEAQVASLPTGPGVYLLKDVHGQVVYVGKSVNVRSRVRTHLRPSGTAHSPAQPRLRRRLPNIADVEAIETGSELEALLLESKLVKRYLPEANSLLRDFHDYPFIKLDLNDPFPRLEATRERPTD